MKLKNVLFTFLLLFSCLFAPVCYAESQDVQENYLYEYTATASPEPTEVPQTTSEKFEEMGGRIVDNNKLNFTVIAILVVVLGVVAFKNKQWK